MISWTEALVCGLIGAVVGYLTAHAHMEHKRHMHELRKAMPMLRKTVYRLGALLGVLVVSGFVLWVGVL
jgi:cytochrome c oxidase assembly factor CtaG